MNRILLSLCLVLVALLGMASVSACDNCTGDGTLQYDSDEIMLCDEVSVEDSADADDAPQHCVERYGDVENPFADNEQPFNVNDYIYYDEYGLYVDAELFEYASELIYYNGEDAMDIMMEDLGISECDAVWICTSTLEYYKIVYNIPPPDEYDPSMYA